MKGKNSLVSHLIQVTFIIALDFGLSPFDGAIKIVSMIIITTTEITTIINLT